MHNTSRHLLAHTNEACLSDDLPGCRSNFCDTKVAVSMLLLSQEVKMKQPPFISGCAMFPGSLLLQLYLLWAPTLPEERLQLQKYLL